MKASTYRTSATRLTSFLLLLIVLTSCASSMQDRVSARLNPTGLNLLFGTKPVDLSLNNACQPATSLTVINKEDKNVRYKADTYHLDSVEFAGSIAKYLEAKLIESNVNIDDVSGKEVHVSIEDLVIGWDFLWEALLIIRVTIPDINFSRLYESRQKRGNIYYALACATHLSTVKFLSEPTVQEYITCNKIETVVQGNDAILSQPLRSKHQKTTPVKGKAIMATAQSPKSRQHQREDPNIINDIILDHPYHIGDNYVSDFKQPNAQGAVFKYQFDISDPNLIPVLITIWVSDMVPRSHERFLRGDYQNQLVVNNNRIAILNSYIYGTKDRPRIDKITIPVDRHIFHNGSNEIEIIAGDCLDNNGNKDDFQVHKIIVGYEKGN